MKQSEGILGCIFRLAKSGKDNSFGGGDVQNPDEGLDIDAVNVP